MKVLLNMNKINVNDTDSLQENFLLTYCLKHDKMQSFHKILKECKDQLDLNRRILDDNSKETMFGQLMKHKNKGYEYL